jgi:hypothetical protein
MKVQFYLLPILLFLFFQTKAQDCSLLSFSYTTSESRCVATGSITVNVTGGSGSYNYKAIGPVSTPVTSSNIITGLPTGYYHIIVKDMTTGCVKEADSAFVPGTYNDPRFQLIKTDASCAGNDGTVSVVGQQFGRSPFSYTIIAPSPSSVGATSPTGSFTGLIPGEYLIRLQDSCGGIQVRRITIENYSWWFDSTSVVRYGCDSVHVFIRIKDNKGNTNTTGPAFSGFTYGYTLAPGDTVWTGGPVFNAALHQKRAITLVVKDNCGNIHTFLWTVPDNVKPSLGSVFISNLGCAFFSASVTGQNLTNPQYCLFDNNNVQITCNTTGTFTHIPYGSYCMKVRDLCYDTTIVTCFTVAQPIPSIAPVVATSNLDCSTFTATVTGQQNLVSPYYCLKDTAGVNITCNTTGVFPNIPYGSYCITVKDGCMDTTIQRCFTVIKPMPVLTGYTITGSDCSSFNVNITGNNLINPNYCLYDDLGNVITCDSAGVFTGLDHGHYCVRAVSCGDTSNPVCFTSAQPIPSVGNGVTILNRKCSTFGVGIWGQSNLVHAQYCLYTASDSLVVCNLTGQFDNIPYGTYCIKVRDGCYDTTITRCFTELGIPPSVNGTLQVLSSTCNTVSFQATGSHLTTPQFCLYDSTDNLVVCNTTGIFNNMPYGRYCVVVHDNCKDTSFRVCQTFTPAKGITLTTAKSCTIGNTFIDVHFANNNAPFTIKVYHPNGSVIVNVTTSSNPYRIELTPVPVSIQYKVVGTDNCGNKDSATVIPDANVVTKSITVRAKCPSSTWLNGAGDIIATTTTNWYAVIPRIIKKDGFTFTRSYSSVTGSVYNFADLEPAQYVVEYTQQTCNGRLYDTVTVPPYAYPTQGQSAIYQCDNNSFSLGADVHGGVSPYTFQIIGSLPETPSIATAEQTSPLFSINTGTIYSLIRLRSVDACGNATLSDVSVLPLQNVSISANNTCFYQNIMLTVDTIPNATYLWYRKTSATDSVLIGSGLSFNLPFFVPEQVGDYVCKVLVNGGCMTRITSFTLDGNCGYQLLAEGIQLNGRKSSNGNQLYWNAATERGVLRYIVERKRPQDAGYIAIGTVPAQGTRFFFNDQNPVPGDNHYRVQLVYANRTRYSNVVRLRSGNSSIEVYPNPVKKEVHINLSSDHPINYLVEIVSAGGQLIYSTKLKQTTNTTITYTRDKNPSGIYLLRITDMDSGISEIRKLVITD